METEELITIKERAKKATNGPWKVYRDEFSVRIGTEYEHNQLKAPAPIVTEAHHVSGKTGIYISDNNAEFIAHAREDVRLLLQKIEELQAAVIQTEIQIQRHELFKKQAEYLLPYFLYEHIEDETQRLWMLEKINIVM